ncbi:hypothetical protein EV714DRAFT_240554, partial [Schizophyllum commune]
NYLAALFFSFNPYHDLESLVWMTIDFVILRASPTALQNRTPQEIVALLTPVAKYAKKIMVSNIRGSPSRQNLFVNGAVSSDFGTLLETTHGPSSPAPSTVVRLIELVRTALANVENASSFDELDALSPDFASRARFPPSAFKDDIYKDMRSTFRKISEQYDTSSEKLVKFCDVKEKLKDLPQESKGTEKGLEASGPAPTTLTVGSSKRRAEGSSTSADPPKAKRSRIAQPAPVDL